MHPLWRTTWWCLDCADAAADGRGTFGAAGGLVQRHPGQDTVGESM